MHSSTRCAHCACCGLQGFPEDLFQLYVEDDDALLRAAHAYWVLTPVTGGQRRSWAALAAWLAGVAGHLAGGQAPPRRV
jgi:hypothetical protein